MKNMKMSAAALKMLIAAAALTAAVSLTGCGASEVMSSLYESENYSHETDDSPASAYADTGFNSKTMMLSADSDSAMNMASDSFSSPAADGLSSPEMEAEADIEAGAVSSGQTTVTGNVSVISSKDAAALSESAAPETKLIRNVSISAETEHYDSMTASVKNSVKALGGYVESSDEYSDYKNMRSCSMTIRVPKDKLDEFLNTALTDGTVLSRSENVEDVTLSYSDIKTRVETLKAEQERLLELMKQADSIESIIALENRLSDISYELENNQSRLKVYDNQVSYSTVYLNISEVTVATPQAKKTLGEKLISGITENVVKIGAFFGALLFLLVINIPLIIVIALIAALTVFIVRKIRKRRKAGKSGKEDKKNNDNNNNDNSSDDNGT